MVLIIYKPKEIQNINRSICLYNTFFSPIKVLGCIIYIIIGNNVTAYLCAANKDVSYDGLIGHNVSSLNYI